MHNHRFFNIKGRERADTFKDYSERIRADGVGGGGGVSGIIVINDGLSSICEAKIALLPPIRVEVPIRFTSA